MAKVRYIVTQREVWVRATEIVADSSEEAITAVEAGEGEELEGLFEYSHTLGRENTTTEISPGPSASIVRARSKVNNESPYTAYFGHDEAVLLVDFSEDEAAVTELELLLGDGYEAKLNKDSRNGDVIQIRVVT